ncbi:MAG: protein kinase domain-containing protein [Vicinamibacterales bacterium]
MAPDYPARIGSYHVLGVIGTGKLGTVYRAYDEAQARVVALRVLSHELLNDAARLERFRREGQALAALSHPNIVSTLDNGKDGELTYLVMEYVDGSSLVDRVRSARPTLNECVQIIREVACGLTAAHAKGIVHGDLVPRNILVSRDLSVVKIVDFGTDIHGTASPSAGTITNARLGALLYRAPELLLNQGGADNRSDIYSLGVMAYEILTGRMPVGKFSLPSAANQQVPLDLDPVILRCLSSDPAQRYQSVNAFLSDLDKVRDVADYQVISELKQLTGGRRSRKSPMDLFAEKPSRTPLYIGLLVLLLVIAGGVAYMMMSRSQPPASSAATAQMAPPAPTATIAPTPPAATAAVPAAPPPPAPAASTPPATPPPATTSPSPAPASPTKSTRPTSPAPTTKAPAAATELPKKAAPEPAPPPMPSPEAAAEALFNEAQTLITNKNQDEARRRLTIIGASYAQTSWFVPAMTAKINLEDRSRLREFDPVSGATVPASLLTRRLLVQQVPKHPTSEAALWWMGETYDDLKLYQLAADAFSQLGMQFPNTRFDAWFRAGELFERRLNNRDAARAAYLKVPSTSSRYKDAQSRSQRLSGR